MTVSVYWEDDYLNIEFLDVHDCLGQHVIANLYRVQPLPSGIYSTNKNVRSKTYQLIGAKIMFWGNDIYSKKDELIEKVKTCIVQNTSFDLPRSFIQENHADKI